MTSRFKLSLGDQIKSVMSNQLANFAGNSLKINRIWGNIDSYTLRARMLVKLVGEGLVERICWKVINWNAWWLQELALVHPIKFSSNTIQQEMWYICELCWKNLRINQIWGNIDSHTLEKLWKRVLYLQEQALVRAIQIFFHQISTLDFIYLWILWEIAKGYLDWTLG